MPNEDITIAAVKVKPGSRRIIDIPMPKLYDWTPMSMPVHVIRGKKPGPALCVTAAIHGDEVNGVEIIRRLLQKKDLSRIHGTLIAVPILNVYGFLYQNRYLMDRRDLNRCFPGSSHGSLGARLAHLVMKDLVANATHMIDLHTGSLHRSNLPQVRANIDIHEVSVLAKAFGAPVILNSKERDGSLRQAANDNKIPMLLYEGGEALRFDEFAIKVGLRGIVNVMRELNMLGTKSSKKTQVAKPSVTHSSYWVRAPFSGIIRLYTALGKHVKKDDVLAVIANPMGEGEHQVLAKHAGIVIGSSNLPLVHAGAALFHIASFREVESVESEIEDLREIHNDDHPYYDYSIIHD